MGATNRWTTARADLRIRRAERDARKALARELAAFDTKNDLLELATILARHADADTEAIRGIVDWNAAA
jgi:hypothetical protein